MKVTDKQMKLETVTQSELIQTQEDKGHMFLSLVDVSFES